MLRSTLPAICWIFLALLACSQDENPGPAYEVHPSPEAGQGGKAGASGNTIAGVGGSTTAGTGGSTTAGAGGSTTAGTEGSTTAGTGGSTTAGAGSSGEAGASNAGAGGEVGGEPPVEGLRVMSFNIQHGAVSNLETIADVIRAEEPDLVGLQELDVNAKRSGFVDQAQKLSQLTGMASLFGASLAFSDGGDYGLALLSRFPILQSNKYKLTSTKEQRILLVADIQTKHGTIPIAVTHLGLSSSERVTQVNEILAKIGNKSGAILMGDMNATKDSPEMKLLANHFSDSWISSTGTGATFPANKPTSRIDFIYLDGIWPTPIETHVPITTASDHLPVVTFVPWF